jgi:hypothetical protein
MTSWKTTAGGMLALLGGIVTIGNMVIGGAQIDPTQISLALAAIGAGFTGLMAKDHNVSNSPSPLPIAKEVVSK